MRKFSLFLLLATSAVPAMAQRGDDGDGQSRERSDNRPQRAERAERSERSQRSTQVEGRAGPQDNGGLVAMRERVQQMQAQQQQQQIQVQQPSGSERGLRYLQRRGETVPVQPQVEGGALAPRERRYRTVPNTNPQVGDQTTTNRDGRVTDHRRYRDGDRRRWTNHWRSDRRYDWRRYRDRNRSIFRIGFYYDPFGYSYRRYSLGSFLYPSYYQSNYWINDPWQYRLPPAYGPYRWVRYHNDALLIDTYTGEVVDVIHGFFW